RLAQEAYDDATSVIAEHKDKLVAIAEALLEVETLDERQIKDIYETGHFTRKDVQDDDEVATAKSFEEAKAAADAKDSEAEARYEHHEEPKPDDESEAETLDDAPIDDKRD
ncbi:MAG: ATP-dependent zinc metalloprotease FtsH, partial [Leuconostoc lactis]